MTRQIIKALLHVEVDASDAEEAYERFVDGLDRIEGLVDLCVNQVEQTEKPYEIPKGAERWGDVAKDIRFSDGFPALADDRRMWGMYDGSWWWTNGHVMLRCEGAPPTDEQEWRRIPDEKMVEGLKPKTKRQVTTLGDVQKTNGGTLFRRTKTIPPVSLSDAYCRLLEVAVTSWLVAKKDVDPVHGLDAEGRLVAIIMPMRIKDEDIVSSDSGGEGGTP